ncbi:hypothetical protein BKA69DRAFT_1103338 [Paraphysoderma sedebokerense]|nr:hypothetical protein BKA69DRAFT_1103338 [Paraphysoderma sedebokerense]
MPQTIDYVQTTIIPVKTITSLITRKLILMKGSGDKRLKHYRFGTERLDFSNGLLQYIIKGRRIDIKLYFCACPPTPIWRPRNFKCRCHFRSGDHPYRILIRIINWCFEYYDHEIYGVAKQILLSLQNNIHISPLPICRRREAVGLVKILSCKLYMHMLDYLLTTGRLREITSAFHSSIDFLRRCELPIPQYLTEWPDFLYLSPNITDDDMLVLMKTLTEAGKGLGRTASGNPIFGVPEFVISFRNALMWGLNLKPWSKQDIEAQKCFGDICLSYGKVVGLGQERHPNLLNWVRHLKKQILSPKHPNDSAGDLGPLDMYEIINNVAETVLRPLSTIQVLSKNEKSHIDRLFRNHVSQHRARIYLLRGDFKRSEPILYRLFNKLIKHKTQNEPKLLLQQVFRMLVEFHIIRGEFMKLKTKCKLVKIKCGDQTHLPDMWLRYIEFRQDGTPIPASDPQFTAWRNQFIEDRWNLALLLQVWGEASSNVFLLEESMQTYNAIPSYLDSYLVLAKIIRLQPSRHLELEWSTAEQFLRNYPLYSNMVSDINKLVAREII